MNLASKRLFRKDPTPLEVAAAELVGAQLAQLDAHDRHERAKAEAAAGVAKAEAELTMFADRIARLRVTIRELSAEEVQP